MTNSVPFHPVQVGNQSFSEGATGEARGVWVYERGDRFFGKMSAPLAGALADNPVFLGVINKGPLCIRAAWG